MSRAFREMVEEAMHAKGWGDYQLGAAIGLLSNNRVFNNTQVRRLREGQRQNLDRELVERLIEVLDLPEAEAWYAAGILPPDMDPDDWRLFRRFIELRRRAPELVAAAERELVAITGEFAAVGTVSAGARSGQRKPGTMYFREAAAQKPRMTRHRRNLHLVPAFAQPAQGFEQSQRRAA